MARVCMSSNSQIGKMRNHRIFRVLLLYNILETVYRVVQAVDGQTYAFVHADGDLRYLMDGVAMEMKEFIKEDDSSVSFTDLSEENLNAYASPIAFHPPLLNFHFHPVGMPYMEHVIVQNLSPDTSIHMLSISGNTLHTHCSFFQEKIIPPGGNTSFDVVLLAREEGPVEDILFIHTSLGSFKFQVSAIGIPNPYRLRPFVGVKMPLNSSYTPVIYMHNPHGSTLQLTEMYSSGGDLHLELPDGENEVPKGFWQIPPYETKAVIKANFIARIEKNHTAFIRIRTNSSNKSYLLLPVEVDVTSAPGIYSPTEILDFGVLKNQDEPKVLTLSLLNSGQKHIHIANVIATPFNEAVDVNFIPVKIPPDTVFSTQVASITFTPSKALHTKQCCGKIVIKSKNNQFKLQIPYQVHLIPGFLDYNKTCTRFYVGRQQSYSIREFNVTNNFNVTIIVYSISLPDVAKRHFSINMTKPVLLTPGKSSPVAFIAFQPSLPSLQLTTYFRLHTNVSHFDIPLLCFTGKLKVFLPHAVNESFIDFGTLGMEDKRTVVFAVINENPVDVNLRFWGSNTSKTYVELVGVDKGNASTLAWRQNFSAMARSLVLKPHHYAIFRVGITAPTLEGVFNGQAFVETQFEKIYVPFSLKTAKGALKVDEVFFENSFPGKISTQSLYVHSTFSHPMTITGLTTVPDDSRFHFDPLKHGSPVLYPNSRTMVGKILFDHRKYCKQKCYSGLPTTTSMGHQWLLGMSLPPDVGDVDRDLFKTLCRRWQSLIDLEEKSTNISLRLDTTEVRGHLLKAHASLQWPRLLSKYSLKFPITQIGNKTVKDFTLENPSSLPILVQVVPLLLYPNAGDMLNVLKERFGSGLLLNNAISDSNVFSLEDLEENNPNPENHIPAYRKSLEEFFGIQSHKKTIAMLLTPGMRVRIQVGFTPKEDAYKSSFILIRNNLTVIDALVVHGHGGHSQIKFGNLSPGSDSVLLFELTEKLLKDCDPLKLLKYSVPNFTVRRAFTARNTGALPVYVRGFDINGRSCEGYGFRVLNCQGFELKPNASKKINIAYTPDFSLTRIQRTLNIRTSQGPDGKTLQFTVVATVPRNMLAHCLHTLPRPFWELYVHYAFLFLSTIVILAVITCAFLDSKRILHATFFPFMTVRIHAEKPEKENIFDLKTISSSAIESNNYAKQNGFLPVEFKKKKDVPEHINILAENCNSSYSNRSVNSALPKKKDLLHSKEYDNQISENNKHSKKKNFKSRQIHENYFLEPNLVELKKCHSRNSWTRFLKPPFSFHSCSNINNKPSVATQTNSDFCEDNSLKALKELDIIGERNINCFINIENNARCKAKNKNENKYNESKNCIKKINVLPEEETSSTTTETSSTTTETSSTTTETSTTESDISEKDPRFCVTSKSQKQRNSKSKGRDSSTDSDFQLPPKSIQESVDSDGFELSTKSRGHKKIKVDPSKIFGGDILQPNSLELPYKPKTVSPEKQKLDSSFVDASLKCNNNVTPKSKAACCPRRVSENYCRKLQKFNLGKPIREPLHANSQEKKDKGSLPPVWDAPLSFTHDEYLDGIVDQTQNFALHQGIHNCLWSSSSSSSDSFQPSSFTNYPSSYSAALCKDVSTNNEEKNNLISFSNKDLLDGYKSSNSFNQKRLQNSKALLQQSAGKQAPFFSTSNIWSTSDLVHINPPQVLDLSGSKLRHWMLQSSTDFDVLSSESPIFRNDNTYSGDDYETFNSNNSSVWSRDSPMSTMQAERRIRVDEYKRQVAAYCDWPGFDLPAVSESLWDSNYNPSVEPWTGDNINLKSSVDQAVSPNIWNQNSVSPEWDSDSFSWKTSCDKCVSDENPQTIEANMCSNKTTDCKNNVGEFDPFHTPSALWMSHLNETKDNFSSSADPDTWSFSLFSDPSHNLLPNAAQTQSEKENDKDENLE